MVEGGHGNANLLWALCPSCAEPGVMGLLPKDPRGGGVFGALASPGRPTHPPTHIRPTVLRQKNETYQRGRKLEADFRYTNCFFFGL